MCVSKFSQTLVLSLLLVLRCNSIWNVHQDLWPTSSKLTVALQVMLSLKRQDLAANLHIKKWRRIKTWNWFVSVIQANDIREKEQYIVTSYIIQLESIMVFWKFEISFPARRLFLLNGKC